MALAVAVAKRRGGREKGGGKGEGEGGGERERERERVGGAVAITMRCHLVGVSSNVPRWFPSVKLPLLVAFFHTMQGCSSTALCSNYSKTQR